MSDDYNEDNGDKDEIQWVFSSPLKTIFAGIFIISTIIRLVTHSNIWDWGIVIGMLGYCVFMVIDKRGD